MRPTALAVLLALCGGALAAGEEPAPWPSPDAAGTPAAYRLDFEDLPKDHALPEGLRVASGSLEEALIAITTTSTFVSRHEEVLP